VPFIRSIGRWTMTALVINGIIGSGIFGVPSEVIRLLGRASTIAMIIAGLGMAIIMVCVAEVASQFSEPGGAYLYVRASFGRFAGLQIGWFSLLTPIGGGAANASLFMAYLGGILPWAAHGWQRVSLLAILILAPVVANYVGVRLGANLSTALTLAKLLPLVLLITLGVARFGHHIELLSISDILSPNAASWLSALLLLLVTYAGYEHALIPTGEVEEPRRTVPFALFTGLVVCSIVYTMVQFVTLSTIGASTTDRPLAKSASVLIGRRGNLLVSLAVMISTYAWVSGAILNVPRLACSLAAHGDFPPFLRKLHPRYNTPATAIVLFAALVWLFAISGTFIWILALAAGSTMIVYSGVCAALIRLRQLRPQADALRVPFGPVFAVLGIVISAAVLTQLRGRQVLLMGVTSLIAVANWYWAERNE
jgi:APA family basic amino acid/polyamine antiporter